MANATHIAAVEAHEAAAAPAGGETPAGETHATTEAHGGAHEVAPSVFGLDATGWVSLAMALLIAVLIWKKVPAMLAGILDKQIAEIRNQLDEASKLRAEAEALKAEYQGKLASAEKEAVAVKAHAEEEAKQLLAEAKTNAADLVARRMKMAEDKIGAAERAAVSEIRGTAVSAATAAAASLIAQTHDAKADKALIDGTIGSLGTIN